MTETKTYTCQGCGNFSFDKDKFKMIVLLGAGWVICKQCLRKWASDD